MYPWTLDHAHLRILSSQQEILIYESWLTLILSKFQQEIMKIPISAVFTDSHI
jgi:hypothetical protein